MNNQEELERALDYPWDKWTIFLHPAQRALVERDYHGAARVGEGESKELIPARKSAEFVIAVITSHAFLEPVCRNVIHQLREYRSAGIHTPL